MKTLKSESDEKSDTTPCVGMKKSKSKRKYEKKLSDRDLRELMGEFRQTYKRSNGAIRRR